jgi:hypothetical protein
VIIQTSIDVPDNVKLNTEDFLVKFEEWLAGFGDLTVDEFEILQDEEA